MEGAAGCQRDGVSRVRRHVEIRSVVRGGDVDRWSPCLLTLVPGPALPANRPAQP